MPYTRAVADVFLVSLQTEVVVVLRESLRNGYFCSKIPVRGYNSVEFVHSLRGYLKNV